MSDKTTIQFTFGFDDLDLEDEEGSKWAKKLLSELRNLDEVERADRAEDLTPEAGSKHASATLSGVLRPEESVKNIKSFLSFLGEHHSDKPIKIKVKIGNEEVEIIDQEGYNILKDLASINDPVLEFRKLVEQSVHEGQISYYRREILYTKNLGIDLTKAQRDEIINSVLNPFNRRAANLTLYRTAYQKEVERHYPIEQRLAKDLGEWGRDVLGLKNEDIAQIQQQISTSKEAAYQHQLEVEKQELEKQRQQEIKNQRRQESVKQQQDVDRRSNISQEKQLTIKTQLFEFKTATFALKSGWLKQKNEINRSQGQAEFFAEDLGDGVSLKMVAIPGGSFKMGAANGEEGAMKNEYPQHTVTIQPFFMGKYTVTQAEWRAIARLPKIERNLSLEPSEFKGNNRPVEQVSWYDAVEFCQRLSQKTGKEYRLPSEAEWEYACRSVISYQLSVTSEESSQNNSPRPVGEGQGVRAYPPFHFGETITTDLANFDGNCTYGDAPTGKYLQKTTPVGKFFPNAFGLYDMHGNVWELCADNRHDNYYGAPTDGSPWIKNGNGNCSVLRGGSWLDSPQLCRSAVRHDINCADFSSRIGFRIVCSGFMENL